MLNDRALGHPNTRGFYFCPLFDVFVLLSFPSSSITTTGEFDFLLTNYTKHKQNNRKRNTQIFILFLCYFLFSFPIHNIHIYILHLLLYLNEMQSGKIAARTNDWLVLEILSWVLELLEEQFLEISGNQSETMHQPWQSSRFSKNIT